MGGNGPGGRKLNLGIFFSDRFQGGPATGRPETASTIPEIKGLADGTNEFQLIKIINAVEEA